MADIGFTLSSKSVKVRSDNYGSRVSYYIVLVASFTYRKQVYKDQKFNLKLALSKTNYNDDKPSQVNVTLDDLHMDFSAGLQGHLGFEINNILKSIPREELSKMLDESVHKVIQERADFDKVNSEAQLKKIAELQKEVSDRMLASVKFLSMVEDEFQKIKEYPLNIRVK